MLIIDVKIEKYNFTNFHINITLILLNISKALIFEMLFSWKKYQIL
jgi:hypothetical protein